MIGLLLRRERRLRWLPVLAFAGLLLGIYLVNDATRSGDPLAALYRGTGVLLLLGMLGGLLPLGFSDLRFELTLPIPPRDLLRCRLLLCTLLVGAPLAIAVTIPALLSEFRADYLFAAAGALGLGLLSSHAPLVPSVTGAQRSPLLQTAAVGLLAAVALLLWVLAARPDPTPGRIACLMVLLLATVHAAALWRTPNERLTVAAGRGEAFATVDQTTVQREITRAVCSRRDMTILAVVTCTAAVLPQDGDLNLMLPILIASSSFTDMLLREAWRRRQLRLVSLPLPNRAGLRRLVLLALAPLFTLLGVRALQNDAQLLANEGGAAAYHEVGREVYAWIRPPRSLRNMVPLGGDQPGDAPAQPFGAILESLRGPVAETASAYRTRLKDLMTTLTGVAPSDAALAAACRPGTERSLSELFPGHPWRRRWADLAMLGAFGLGCFLLTAHFALRARVYPGVPRHARGSIVVLSPFVYVTALILSHHLARLELHAALAVLAQPAWILLAAVPLAYASWRLLAKLHHAELQMPTLYGRRYPRPSRSAAAAG